MHGLNAVFKRELLGYFQTPVAYVFLVVFLVASHAFPFYVDQFFERGKADMAPFFNWHPWLYLFLVPALTMRLWAEERRSGTLELLMTLPLPSWQLVLGKYLAAWCFTTLALVLTMPLWITVNYLGKPDNGVILASYLGSLLLAGGYLAMGACLSATTRNQVIAFVVTVTACLVFTLAGFQLVLSFFEAWLPQPIVETIGLFGLLTHFSDISQGIVEFRSLFYLVTLILFWLSLNWLVVEAKRE
ncbi:MAG: ABC transporter permease subunit [Rickettsiales bacterium]|nr:ABC transporter permease subunit [Rickettsiales bacterium]